LVLDSPDLVLSNSCAHLPNQHGHAPGRHRNASYSKKRNSGKGDLFTKATIQEYRLNPEAAINSGEVKSYGHVQSCMSTPSNMALVKQTKRGESPFMEGLR
jgi:hypothetical protein